MISSYVPARQIFYWQALVMLLVIVVLVRPRPPAPVDETEDPISSAEERARGRAEWLNTKAGGEEPAGLDADFMYRSAVSKYGVTFAKEMRHLADSVAREFNVPAAWVWYTWWVESKLNYRAENPTTKARGFQQITPETARTIKTSYVLIKQTPKDALNASRNWYKYMYQNWEKGGKPNFSHIGYFYATQLAPELMYDREIKKKKYKSWFKTNEVCRCGKSNPGFGVAPGKVVTPEHLKLFFLNYGLTPV